MIHDLYNQISGKHLKERSDEASLRLNQELLASNGFIDFKSAQRFFDYLKGNPQGAKDSANAVICCHIE